MEALELVWREEHFYPAEVELLCRYGPVPLAVVSCSTYWEVQERPHVMAVAVRVCHCQAAAVDEVGDRAFLCLRREIHARRQSHWQ